MQKKCKLTDLLSVFRQRNAFSYPAYEVESKCVGRLWSRTSRRAAAWYVRTVVFVIRIVFIVVFLLPLGSLDVFCNGLRHRKFLLLRSYTRSAASYSQLTCRDVYAEVDCSARNSSVTTLLSFSCSLICAARRFWCLRFFWRSTISYSMLKQLRLAKNILQAYLEHFDN